MKSNKRGQKMKVLIKGVGPMPQFGGKSNAEVLRCDLKQHLERRGQSIEDVEIEYHDAREYETRDIANDALKRWIVKNPDGAVYGNRILQKCAHIEIPAKESERLQNTPLKERIQRKVSKPEIKGGEEKPKKKKSTK